MDENNAWTEMGPGPELLRLEAHPEFVPKKFLGFGTLVSELLWHRPDAPCLLLIDEVYTTRCGTQDRWKSYATAKVRLEKCPECWKPYD